MGVVARHIEARAPGVAAPGLTDQVQEYLSEVRLTVARAFAERAVQASGIATDAEDLWTGLHAQVGGKWGRPRLALAAFLGCGGQRPAAIVPVAGALEVLHTAMLVHDDLLDGDELRRGTPNLAGHYRRWAAGEGYADEDLEDVVRAASLLGGDLAIALAVDLVLAADVTAGRHREVLGLLTGAIFTTVAGELLDVLAQSDQMTIKPERIAAAKTAHYSCEVPLVAGALCAGASPEVVESLRSFGAHLGVAFQTADDYAGVFGDPDVTGKSVLRDLQRGKRTVLLETARQRVTAEQAHVLASTVGSRTLTEDDAAQIRQIFHETGAVRDARRAIDENLSRARSALGEAVPPELAAYLYATADRVERSLS